METATLPAPCATAQHCTWGVPLIAERHGSVSVKHVMAKYHAALPSRNTVNEHPWGVWALDTGTDAAVNLPGLCKRVGDSAVCYALAYTTHQLPELKFHPQGSGGFPIPHPL